MWQKGQSGNPGGRPSEKVVTDALRAAVNVEDPKTRRRKLLMIADTAVDLAVAGEAWAIQFVADRLDGKPAQEATITHQHRQVTEWTDQEIAQRIVELGAGRTGAVNGNGKAPDDPSQLH